MEGVTMSQIGQFQSGTVLPDIETITGNSGGAVGPDGAGDIGFTGSGSITVVGTPGTNSLDISIVAPISVADGGTGNTSFTAGSVLFSNGSIITEDNSNLFWDDTNNRLGIGTTTPLRELHVVGSMELVHLAAESDDHALEIDCDAAGFGDVKALDIAYVTGAIGAGFEEEAILINIDETLSTGGEVFGIEVLSTAEGSANIFGAKLGVGVNPILQNSGTFGNADTILVLAVDQRIPLSSGGAGNITTFVADTDTVTIGDAAQFAEIEFIVDTGASGAGIKPTFEFSTGVGTWTVFAPSDGTNGLRNTGIVDWDIADIPGWLTGAGTKFLIRITRTRNTVNTVPILDLVQIGGTSVFSWNKTGDVVINSLTLSTALTVPNGGTGVASNTAYAVLCGGTTSTNPIQSIASVGTATQVLTSNGAGALPTFQANTSFTWNEETGTSATMAVDNGYIANNGGLVTLTLPTTAAVGSIVRVAGKGAGGWRIAQNAGETINFGSSPTTPGAGGYLEFTNQFDAVELVCITANTDWNVLSSVGNITVV